MTIVDDSGDLKLTAAPTAPAAGPDADHITLSLNDLLPDANGEIVVVSPQGQLHLNIVTDLQISESGIADSHLTADGTDVNGLSFFTFEGGMRLYYSPEVEITIATHAG
ncbi:MAG TPA: hypothetical protein VHA10_23775 [Hypericibacter adhaerens]|nr:hypothetical protein [Hypericibacter adhaerens]HWA46257.1 hypothetical protein [Hypericibacter adhaerens]